MTPDSKARLLLMPTCIGETSPDEVLPARYLSKIEHLRTFFVEDLRSARRFLRKVGFRTPFEEVCFIELNEHSKGFRLEDILKAQQISESEICKADMGVLSEAGLPCIADPGSLAVEWAHRKGIQVVPLSGPSSIFMALMASGFNGQSFAFHGYLPIESKERAFRIRELENLSRKTGQSQIFIETPYRSQTMLQSLIENCYPETRICVACNISLADEFILTRTTSQWKKTKADIHKKNTVFVLSA